MMPPLTKVYLGDLKRSGTIRKPPDGLENVSCLSSSEAGTQALREYHKGLVGAGAAAQNPQMPAMVRTAGK